MNMIFALSVDAITDDILAETALRHYLDNDCPRVLTRDQKPALERMIRSAIASLAVELGATVTAVAEADVVTLELADVPPTASAAALRQLMQQAVGAEVTATAYSGADEAKARRFEQLHSTAMACIKACLNCGAAAIAPARM